MSRPKKLLATLLRPLEKMRRKPGKLPRRLARRPRTQRTRVSTSDGASDLAMEGAVAVISRGADAPVGIAAGQCGGRQQGQPLAEAFFYEKTTAARRRLARIETPIAPNPSNISAHVEGSGTAAA